jgi:capsular exopolysaccharide synthesis family protein
MSMYPLDRTAPVTIEASSPSIYARSRGRAPVASKPPALVLLQSIWSGFLRWWKVGIPLGILLSVASGFAAWKLVKPVYRSQAVLRIRSETPYLAFRDGNGSPQYVRTQLETIRMRAVLGPALEAIVKKYPEVLEHDDPLAWLEKEIKLSTISNSEFLRVAFENSNSELAQAVLNSVLDSYFLYRRESDASVNSSVIELLVKERDRREQILTKMRDQYRELTKESAVSIMDPKAPPKENLLDAVQKLMVQAEVDLEVTRAQYEVQRRTNSGEAAQVPTEELEMVVNSQQEVVQLQSLIAKLEGEKASWEEKMVDPSRHRRYTEVAEQLEKSQKALSEIRAEAAGTLQAQVAWNRKQQMGQLENEIKSKEAMIAYLSQRMSQEKVQTVETTEKTVDLEFLKTELERQEEVFDAIVSRIVKLQTEEFAPERVVLTDPPSKPLVPENKPYFMVALAAAGTLLLPMAAAIALEQFAGRINDSSGVENSNLEVIGEIAKLPRYVTSPEAGDASSSQSVRLFQQSVDQLGTMLRMSSDHSDKRIISIASAVSGEGKTHVAMQLARSLGRSCKVPVLLVEADCRSPSICKYAGLKPGPGLLDVLNGTCSDIREAIVPVRENLAVLTAGKRKGSLQQLMDPATIAKLLEDLREHYGYVIIDTPPVLAAGEALLFTSQSDATLVCARVGFSRISQVQRAYDVLSRAKSNPVGVVVNGTPKNKYVYSYGDYGSAELGNE